MCLWLPQLRDAGVIAMDQDEFSVQPTPHGVLFSRFMVRFESMKALMNVSESHGTRSVTSKGDSTLFHNGRVIGTFFACRLQHVLERR